MPPIKPKKSQKKKTTDEPKKKERTAKKAEKTASAPLRRIKKNTNVKGAQPIEKLAEEIIASAPVTADAQPKPFSGDEAKYPQPTDAGREGRYFETVGRRKRAVARVRLYTSRPQDSAEAGNMFVNDKPYKQHFSTETLQTIVESPLRKLKSLNRFRATVHVAGGGIRGQAEAVRHGLARALVLFDPNFRKRMRRAGYLTRDPREKERRKYGLKKARRAPQWAKR